MHALLSYDFVFLRNINKPQTNFTFRFNFYLFLFFFKKKMERQRLLMLSLHLCLLATNSAAAAGSKVPAIFVFGDSIFDAGNNHYNPNCSVQADFPPYGSTFFRRPTGRFTNGRTVADFIGK